MFQDIELEFDELRGDDDLATFGDEQQAVPNDEEILAKLAQESKPSGKQRVFRPRPKLDAERLCGPRGIETIPKLFEDFKIRGKGHEFEDLNEMMNKLEHWAHRLFPQMPFDEALARLETLGSKNMVRNTMSRIRYDEAMPSFNEEEGKFQVEKDNFEEADLVKRESPIPDTFFDNFNDDDDLVEVNIS